ncbi:MAG: Dam family site-specific DNA-(adenine-N6)-methyltransferase [Chloroflexota bacterium]
MSSNQQQPLPLTFNQNQRPPFKTQLLKWVGNKQRYAHEIISYFPESFDTYYEPFLGSGAVMATLAPAKGVGSDVLEPLMEIWQMLSDSPMTLIEWYESRWHILRSGDKKTMYEKIKADYNSKPNGADLLFLLRSCYGGVVRFRKDDGYMSTPCGVHDPINPQSFARRVYLWHERTNGMTFFQSDFEAIIDHAKQGDLVYCDPPYKDTQAILYGAQTFTLARLFTTIARAKERGVFVVLSIDGSKKTGKKQIDISIPNGLFENEVSVNCGKSMLRRFQKLGETLEDEVVTDRLLLTY